MRLRGAAFALLLCGLSSVRAEAEWIEAYDKNTNRNFFYHSESRETAWEAPAGANVRRLGADASGGASGGAAPKSSDPLKIVLGLLLPIVLPIAGLLIFYWQASNQGLGEVLKRLKAKRDRSRKRRGASAGGNFRHRQKLSQDGKGGRSANS